MRLIDANDFFERLCDRDCDIVPQYSEDGYSIERIEETLNATPTVDAEPVTNGEWISEDADVLFRCSICGAQVSTGWDYEGAWNYCPDCGARMCGSYEK